MSKCLVQRKGAESCFPPHIIDEFIDTINHRYNPKPKLRKSGSVKDKWNRVTSFMGAYCENPKDEGCWVDKLHVRNAEYYLQPKSPVYWKTMGFSATRSDTVTDIIKRWEVVLPNFTYLGTFPLDFQKQDKFGRCIGNFMCTFSVAPLAKDKMCFGMVINTHPEHMTGEHWVAVFCETDPDKPSYGIHFYDSYGMRPKKLIYEFVKMVVAQMSDKKFKYDYNTHTHQRKLQNCGIHCAAMIIECAKGVNFKTYCAQKHNDSTIEKYRQELFRDYKGSHGRSVATI